MGGAGKKGRVRPTMVVEQGLVGMAMDRESVCFVGASWIKKSICKESMLLIKKINWIFDSKQVKVGISIKLDTLKKLNKNAAHKRALVKGLSNCSPRKP